MWLSNLNKEHANDVRFGVKNSQVPPTPARRVGYRVFHAASTCPVTPTPKMMPIFLADSRHHMHASPLSSYQCTREDCLPSIDSSDVELQTT
jgi:hypothetical protein